jgi:hypothetical protein
VKLGAGLVGKAGQSSAFRKARPQPADVTFALFVPGLLPVTLLSVGSNCARNQAVLRPTDYVFDLVKWSTVSAAWGTRKNLRPFPTGRRTELA